MADDTRSSAVTKCTEVAYKLREMAYTENEARTELLEDLGRAVDQLGVAVAGLGEAYEALDEQTADALEDQLFRPAQAAYGRAKRTHAEFANRYRLPGQVFEERSPGQHSGDPRAYIERAIDATEHADHAIAELQDSMRPVEVGDTELRAGLSQTRELIAHVPARGRQLLRTLGR